MLDASEKVKGQLKSETKVASLLSATGLNQAQLADEIGVAPSLISLVAKGEREPSVELLVQLGKVAMQRGLKTEALWFWKRAGIDSAVLDAALDLRMREKTADASEFTFIEALDPEDKETIPFPSRVLKTTSLARFLRVEAPGEPFKIGHQDFGGEVRKYKAGDILIVDTRQTDLREIEDGAIVALRMKSGNKTCDCFGEVRRSIFGEDVRYYFLHIAADVDKNVGISRAKYKKDKGTPVKLFGDGSYVLGRVIGWFSQGGTETA